MIRGPKDVTMENSFLLCFQIYFHIIPTALSFRRSFGSPLAWQQNDPSKRLLSLVLIRLYSFS